MNIVSIDPSLISTALIINGKIINYCKEDKAHGKKGLNKWYKIAEEHVEFKFINYNKESIYSKSEIKKLNDYNNVTDLIIKDILSHINKNENTKIALEGYNFGAKVGDLIDLVTFSTLLRLKLYNLVSKDIIIISPATLKLEACKLTYPPTIIKKNKKGSKDKIIYKNNLGIPGGKFQKIDMYLSIIENNELNDNWKKHCLSIKDDILSLSNIPKPYDDINDSYLLYHIIKKQLESNKDDFKVL